LPVFDLLFWLTIIYENGNYFQYVFFKRSGLFISSIYQSAAAQKGCGNFDKSYISRFIFLY